MSNPYLPQNEAEFLEWQRYALAHAARINGVPEGDRAAYVDAHMPQQISFTEWQKRCSLSGGGPEPADP